MNVREARRHDAFVALYVCDPRRNAAKAAIGAGYNEKCARQYGYRLLKMPAIRKKIDALIKKQENKVEYSKEKWLKEHIAIAHSDLRHHLDVEEGGGIIVKVFKDMPKETTRALESIEEIRTIKESADGKDSNVVNSRIRIKLWNKLEALEQLGKHFGYLKNDKIEIPGVEKALYELSEKFLPAMSDKAKTRSDEPK